MPIPDLAGVSVLVTGGGGFLSQRADRRQIRPEWIEAVVAHPEREVIQADGRALRVILLADGETVHNVFFDRRYKQ